MGLCDRLWAIGYNSLEEGIVSYQKSNERMNKSYQVESGMWTVVACLILIRSKELIFWLNHKFLALVEDIAL